MQLKLALPLLLAAICTSCQSADARRYSISVSALASKSRSIVLDESPTFVLVPELDQGSPRSELEVAEALRVIATGLQDAGWQRVDKDMPHDLEVLAAWTISDPERFEQDVAIPTYGPSGNSTTTTTGQATVYGNSIYGSSASTTYTAPMLTGFRSLRVNRTIYRRALTLHAVDSEGKSVWEATAQSSGSSGDLRRVLPKLVYAIRPYVGTTSTHAIELELLEDAQTLREFELRASGISAAAVPKLDDEQRQ